MNLQMLVNIGFHSKNIEITYFDSFGLGHVPKEIEKFIGIIKAWKQTYLEFKQFNNVWILCIGFIGFMFACKTLIDFTNLLSPNGFEKNDNIILSYFKNE